MGLINKFLGFDENKQPQKEEAPSPAPENQEEQQQSEDEGYHVNPALIIQDKELLNYAAGHLRQSFGVHNLDEILNTFAPDTIDLLNRVYKQANASIDQNNETHRKQQVYYDFTKKLILEQREEIDELKTMMKAIMNHMNVSVPEKKPPQEGLTR